jgi:hypothetical protein
VDFVADCPLGQSAKTRFFLRFFAFPFSYRVHGKDNEYRENAADGDAARVDQHVREHTRPSGNEKLVQLVKAGDHIAGKKRDINGKEPFDVKQMQIEQKQGSERGEFRKVRGFSYVMIYARYIFRLLFLRHVTETRFYNARHDIPDPVARTRRIVRVLPRHYEHPEKHERGESKAYHP